MGTSNILLGVTMQWPRIPSREYHLLLVTSCYRNWVKLWPCARLGTISQSSSLICSIFVMRKPYSISPMASPKASSPLCL